MTSDVLRLIAVRDGVETLLGQVDGRSLSAEPAASSTGRVCGLFAVSGAVAFDGLRYRVSEA